jgi:tRNA modification GTPase
MLFVGNKMDAVKDVEKAEGIAKEQLRVFFPSGNIEEQFVSVSALQKESAEVLMERLWKRVNEGKFRDRALISQARHFENLSMARDNLMRTLEALKLLLSNEFIVIELKEALLRIQETIGKRFDDQIVDRIFKDFCVGK